MSKTIKKREEIDSKYQWKLEDIYDDEKLWEDDFDSTKELLREIEGLKGTMAKSADALLKVLELSNQLERKVEKLYVYSRMRRDENNANQYYQALFDRAQSLGVEVSSATSFIVPEISAIPPESLEAFLNQKEELAVYRHFFQEIARQREHILSPAEERLMAMSADLAMAAGSIFNMLNNADIKFPLIKDEFGQEIELTKGRFSSFMESQDRRVRQDVFMALYSTYHKLINTLGASLNASVKKDIFYARARGYNSALESALNQDNVSPRVYEQLIKTVHDNLKLMHRYMAIRKKVLGVSELHMYDIYVPLVKEYKVDIPYEKAREMVIEAMEKLGPEYTSILKKGLQGGWIDVFENEGKTSGAYSWGTFDTNPYVLMNYDNKLDDAFTLAHEMGHSLHSYYSNHTQPYIYSQYSIFVAEVASTVNESLLIDCLLAKSQNRQEKMYLINHYLEQFRGTLYRQTMFAEFEKIIHQKAEQGEALTPELMNQVYRDLNRLYYGPDIFLDQEIDWEWVRIPHFYSAFYVYKYATGFSAATALKEQIVTEGEGAINRYISFLKSGSSDYPINLLKKAGVDLTAPEPVQQALLYFGKLLDELESLL